MEIASTMGAGSLGRELDLDQLTDDLVENTETPIDINYTSDSVVTVYIGNSGNDNHAYTLYRTGAFQIRGTRTETGLYEAESRLRTLLSELGIEFSNYNFRHANSVFVGTLDTSVNLESLTIALGLENTEYEPEQFPAIIYRPPEFIPTLLIFSTGKVIVGGTIDREKSRRALRVLEQKVASLDTT
jgi:transcription initiation factor TFIID TATA-box-binding protein